MKLRRWATRTVAVALPPVLLVLAGCTGGKGHDLPAVVRPAMQFTLVPSTGAKNLPASTEIGTTVAGGKVTSVTLVDSTQKSVTGSFRPDGSSWVPAEPLAFDRTYTATLTATSLDGQRETKTTTFSTMKNPGSNRIGTGLYFQSGQTYGVGMPVAIDFDSDIPDSAKAAVERRLFVTSDPPQVGAWRWYGDRQVLYRPQNYWQPGTKLTVRAALGGLPVGHQYLDQDRGGTAAEPASDDRGTSRTAAADRAPPRVCSPDPSRVSWPSTRTRTWSSGAMRTGRRPGSQASPR